MCGRLWCVFALMKRLISCIIALRGRFQAQLAALTLFVLQIRSRATAVRFNSLKPSLRAAAHARLELGGELRRLRRDCLLVGRAARVRKDHRHCTPLQHFSCRERTIASSILASSCCGDVVELIDVHGGRRYSYRCTCYVLM